MLSIFKREKLENARSVQNSIRLFNRNNQFFRVHICVCVYETRISNKSQIKKSINLESSENFFLLRKDNFDINQL